MSEHASAATPAVDLDAYLAEVDAEITPLAAAWANGTITRAEIDELRFLRAERTRAIANGGQRRAPARTAAADVAPERRVTRQEATREWLANACATPPDPTGTDFTPETAKELHAMTTALATQLDLVAAWDPTVGELDPLARPQGKRCVWLRRGRAGIWHVVRAEGVRGLPPELTAEDRTRVERLAEAGCTFVRASRPLPANIVCREHPEGLLPGYAGGDSRIAWVARWEADGAQPGPKHHEPPAAVKRAVAERRACPVCRLRPEDGHTVDTLVTGRTGTQRFHAVGAYYLAAYARAILTYRHRRSLLRHGFRVQFGRNITWQEERSRLGDAPSPRLLPIPDGATVLTGARDRSIDDATVDYYEHLALGPAPRRDADLRPIDDQSGPDPYGAPTKRDWEAAVEDQDFAALQRRTAMTAA